MKVSELSGAKLDYWVAKAEGLEKGRSNYIAYSTVWHVGGPIIERERFTIWMGDDEKTWKVRRFPGIGWVWHGETLLIAAMRCYVASKFGETVPDDK